MIVRNRIDACRALERTERRDRGTYAIEYVVLHRLSPTLRHWKTCTDAVDFTEAFARHPELREAFGRSAYHIYVWPDGRIEQAVELSYQTPHARRWNPRSVGVACVGDWRTETPTPAMYRALQALLPALCGYYLASIVGHDELPGASSDPAKICPGHLLDLATLRQVSAVGECLDLGEIGIVV